MNFQCRNCSANMVFDPDRQKLVCPFCDGVDCADKKGDTSMVTCPSCGGELNPGEYTSATRCPSCGNYIIFDARVSEAYKPDRIIPFKLSKKRAVEELEKEFSDRIFTPSSFLSEKTLKDMNGYYVPFFLYDYHVDAEYVGEGSASTSWREGNYKCTETRHYLLSRKLKADYDNVPADASIAMPDSTMDLMEPYDYQVLTDFDPEFMSGFFGEVYNMSADDLAERADAKATKSVDAIMRGSMANYSLSAPTVNNKELKRGEVEYALFPVWKYDYFYRGEIYTFYVNGQSGKVVGKTPVSKRKVFWYGLATAGLWGIMLDMIFGMLGSLIF